MSHIITITVDLEVSDEEQSYVDMLPDTVRAALLDTYKAAGRQMIQHLVAKIEPGELMAMAEAEEPAAVEEKRESNVIRLVTPEDWRNGGAI
jgi:hypothetical protein